MELALKIVKFLSEQPIPADWQQYKINPYTIFKNYQPGKVHGLRLTMLGWEFMRMHFKYWTYQLPSGWSPKPSHLLGLQQHLDWPYYHGAGYLRLFGENDVIEIRLCGDDPILWLDGLGRNAIVSMRNIPKI